ncbi:PAS domain-containing protein [Klebsiella quasipneumoniae]|uniref:helix-turn-helix transcriptional regulator n=1 Tax=Klebsiella quasipneumoniae TaxID=1463165 RepID=UPI00244A966F|nr:PAS domain-containing protein [Klebsiella quasipneumoniae]MDH2712394.1 PAS domain-containing protein [Klebsiella quasipneumoniae]
MKNKKLTSEQQLILEQVTHIASALGSTFAPFAEVVVHDLRSPQNAILGIFNNLSGRQVGDPVTELGLARIENDSYPQVVANYANQFADGRRVKSTSIGIKDSEGHYFAALCLNVDMTVFRGISSMIEQFSAISEGEGKESLDPNNADALRDRIDRFATSLATTPRALRTVQRRDLVQKLKEEGFLGLKRSMDIVAQHLGVSRATVYNDIK